MGIVENSTKEPSPCVVGNSTKEPSPCVVFAESHNLDRGDPLGSHQYVRLFRDAGWDCLWLGPAISPMHLGKPDALNRHRFRVWREGGREVEGISWLVPLTLLFYYDLPLLRSLYAGRNQYRFCLPTIGRQVREAGFAEVDLLWCAGPVALGLLDLVPHRVSCYRIADRLDRFNRIPNNVAVLQEELIRRVDFVLATSRALWDWVRTMRRDDVYYLPNGVEESFFLGAEGFPAAPFRESGQQGELQPGDSFVHDKLQSEGPGDKVCPPDPGMHHTPTAVSNDPGDEVCPADPGMHHSPTAECNDPGDEVCSAELTRLYKTKSEVPADELRHVEPGNLQAAKSMASVDDSRRPGQKQYQIVRRDPPDVFPACGRPVALYIGTVDTRFDTETLAHAVQYMRDMHFVVIGPVTFDEARRGIEALQNEDNFTWLGPRAHAELPAYIAHSAVGLIPFHLNELTEAVNPIKYFEYLAGGLPVVAPPMRELLEMKGPIFLYHQKDEFCRAIRQACEVDEKERKTLTNFARKHTWRSRFTEITSILEKFM